MALKAVYESQEEIPESLREHYPEKDGKFHFVGVEGYKPASEIESVQKALNAERGVSKKHKESLTAWETKFQGKSVDEVFALVERIPVLEAESQGKIDQKKMDSIVDQTVKNRIAPLDAEIKKLNSLVAERDQAIQKYEAANKRRTIHDAVRALAAKEGFQEQAYASADGALMMLAERHLTVNEIGQVVVADDNMSYTPGLGVADALTAMKNHHPYLLKASLGGGAQGGGAGGVGSNPFKANDLDARGRFMQQNPDKWETLMKQAGLSDPSETYKAK
jgi:hypothetical protein